MNKIIVTVDTKGNSEEHPLRSFKEVAKLYEGQNVNVFLDKYNETTFGSIFHKRALIGNFKYNLDYVDYWRAYDEVIN